MPRNFSINVGSVYKIYYFVTFKKHRRVFSFVGLCINNNKRTNSFSLQNYYGKEFIWLNFPLLSPNILFLEHIKSYNFKTRLSKLYNFKKLYLTTKNQKLTTFVLSEKKLEPIDYITGAVDFGPIKKKKLRAKFRI